MPTPNKLITKAQARPFFAYSRAREGIRVKKDAGGSKPWTKDEVLLNHRFCNVFREDDKVTRWFAENLRHVGSPLLSALAFRWFNRITTGEVLQQEVVGLQDGDFDAEVFKELMLASMPKGPYVTGAYIINTPPGYTKLDGVIYLLSNVLPDVEELEADMVKSRSLEKSHAMLCGEYERLGSFMAYEVITDLQFTPTLSQATDRSTWAALGPGAARGLSRLLYGNIDSFSYSRKVDQVEMLRHMRKLLDFANGSDLWDTRRYRQWEMREVEHTLCEFDKYERLRLGQGSVKQKYKGAA